MGDNHRITYLSGGQSKNTITLKEWDTRCMEYFNTYYSQYKKLIFPQMTYNKNPLYLMTEKLLTSLDDEDGPFYIFSRYDLINHVRMHIGNDEEYNKLLKHILIDSDEEMKRCDNRMLLFIPKQNMVVNIRTTVDNDSNAVQEEENIGKCDLKLILFLFQRLIKCSGITLMNVILAPNLSTKNDCMSCDKCHVIDRELFSNIDELTKWWKHKINAVMNQTNANNEIRDSSIHQIIATTFGFAGTRQINVNDASIPKFSADNTSTHANVVNLLLTSAQSRAIDDPSPMKIVFGGYGAGKSVVGMFLLF